MGSGNSLLTVKVWSNNRDMKKSFSVWKNQATVDSVIKKGIIISFTSKHCITNYTCRISSSKQDACLEIENKTDNIYQNDYNYNYNRDLLCAPTNRTMAHDIVTRY